MVRRPGTLCTRGAKDENDLELSITAKEQHLADGPPGVFLNERRVRECLVRFDVLTIEKDSGRMPEVRL